MLWMRRRSMLDLWLIVALCAYAIELPLTYYPNPIRFSIGWYTVRIAGFFSSVIVLIVLLYEITTIYERLLRAVLAQRREREARLMTGDAVAATIAHEIKQPLSAMITRADTGLYYLDHLVPDLDKAREQFKIISADGHRAGAVIQSIRANYKKVERPRTSLNVNDLIGEAIGLLRSDLKEHRIQVQAAADVMLPRVMGDPIQLQQVLLNLITNAIDSMAAKDGPRILDVRSERLRMMVSWYRLRTLERASEHKISIGYSIRCLRQNRAAWGWVFRSAVRLSRPTIADCWLSRTMEEAPYSNLSFPSK